MGERGDRAPKGRILIMQWLTLTAARLLIIHGNKKKPYILSHLNS